MIAFGSASLYFGIGAWRWYSRFYAWVDAKPMQLTIDLSTPATYAAPFKQTCAMAHSQSIYVSLDDPDVTDENIGEYFTGLQGTVTIRDPNGELIVTKPFGSSGMRLWGDSPMLVSVHPFASGDYIAEIKIDQGATAFANTPHDLYARYDLCGLELMPAYMFGAVSAVAGLIAFTIGCCIVPSLVQQGFRGGRDDDK